MSNLDKYTDSELFDILESNVEDEIRSRGYEYGWYKRDEYAGYIYILVNPAFSSLVKIGYADNVLARVKSLNSNSGLPDPYHVYAIYKVKKRLEDLKLHNLIDSLNPTLRHAKNREFYDMTPERAYDILAAIAEINGNEELLLKNPYKDEFFVDVSKESSVVNPGGKKPIVRQPPFNFHEFGIDNGEILVFYDAKNKVLRPEITAIVAGERSIQYDGKLTSMSAVAGDIMGLKNSPRGTAYWTYKGKLLVDYYMERYPKPKHGKQDC